MTAINRPAAEAEERFNLRFFGIFGAGTGMPKPTFETSSDYVSCSIYNFRGAYMMSKWLAAKIEPTVHFAHVLYPITRRLQKRYPDKPGKWRQVQMVGNSIPPLSSSLYYEYTAHFFFLIPI